MTCAPSRARAHAQLAQLERGMQAAQDDQCIQVPDEIHSFRAMPQNSAAECWGLPLKRLYWGRNAIRIHQTKPLCPDHTSPVRCI